MEGVRRAPRNPVRQPEDPEAQKKLLDAIESLEHAGPAWEISEDMSELEAEQAETNYEMSWDDLRKGLLASEQGS